MSTSHEEDGKKLKQGRLPFQRVNPETLSSPAEKRKATDEGQLKRKREKSLPKNSKENACDDIIEIDLTEDSKDGMTNDVKDDSKSHESKDGKRNVKESPKKGKQAVKKSLKESFIEGKETVKNEEVKTEESTITTRKGVGKNVKQHSEDEDDTHSAKEDTKKGGKEPKEDTKKELGKTKTTRKSSIMDRLCKFQFQKADSPSREEVTKEKVPGKEEITELEEPTNEAEKKIASEEHSKSAEASQSTNDRKSSPEKSPEDDDEKVNKNVPSRKRGDDFEKKSSEKSEKLLLESCSLSKNETSPIPNKKSRSSEKEPLDNVKEEGNEALHSVNAEENCKDVEEKTDKPKESSEQDMPVCKKEDEASETKTSNSVESLKKHEDNSEVGEVNKDCVTVVTKKEVESPMEKKDTKESDEPIASKESFSGAVEGRSPDSSMKESDEPIESKESLSGTMESRSPGSTSKESEDEDTEMAEVTEEGEECDKSDEKEESIVEKIEKCSTPTSRSTAESKTPKSNEKKLSTTRETRKSTTPGAIRKRSLNKVLTPSQLKKQKEKELLAQEKLKAKEEKERLKKEKLAQKEREKQQKEQEKLEKEKARKEKLEQKEKERQEKEKERLEKEKERQEKLKKKQEELDLKAELKKKKEDERKQQEEEKKKKDEEKKKQEEEKKKQEEEKRQKEEKSKAVFRNFFNVKKTDGTKDEKEKQHGTFKPFEVQENTQIAPARRASCGEDKVRSLDIDMDKQTMPLEELYLKTLKKIHCVRKTSRTWQKKKDDDIEIIAEYEDNKNIIMEDWSVLKKNRWKLLQFEENVRPAYWGTWKKKSNKVKPRNPFKKDETLLNYEVDSGDEWEEEPEGEDLAGSEEEKESDDDYEVDNDLFVPHGYLSEDEDGEEDQLSPEAQRERLKMKALEFDIERKLKTSTLKPRLIECKWENDIKIVPEKLLRYSAIFLYKAPISTTFSVQPVKPESPVAENSAKSKSFPEEAIPSLLRLIHCNHRSRFLLNEEFKDWWSEKGPQITSKTTPHHIPKRRINTKIHELATWMRCPDAGPLQNRKCWYVSPQVRKQYGLDESSLPYQWVYLSEKVKAHSASAKPIEKSPKADNSITRFTTPTSKLASFAAVSPITPKTPSSEGKPDQTTPLSRKGIQLDSHDKTGTPDAQRGNKRRNQSPGLQQQQPPKKRVPITTLTTFLGARKPRGAKDKPTEKKEPDVITLD